MIDLAGGAKSVFLDVSTRLVALGIDGPGSFDERGLLGFAFDPEFADTGLLYTYTSEPTADAADFSTIPVGEQPHHQSVILEWRGRASTFLPQVWEQLPEPADFMSQLKRKAGVRADFWHADLRLSRYRVRKFVEAAGAQR